MKKIFALGVLFLAAPTFAAPTYYMAGDFNGWNPAGNLMTETSAGSGIWQVSLANVSGRHEFKITDGSWAWNYPSANSWFYGDPSGNITVSFDLNTYADGWQSTSQRIGLSYDPGTWTIAGDFQGWNNANPATAMAPVGGGIFTYQTELTPGLHSWKAVVTGSWDSVSWDNRSIGTANYDVTVTADATLASFFVNAVNGTVKMSLTAVPEPSSLTLLGLGLAGLLALRRRQ